MTPQRHEDTEATISKFGLDAWQFGRLDRAARTITQDIDLYVLPSNLEQLLLQLIGILKREES
jgi:hypothetical protein